MMIGWAMSLLDVSIVNISIPELQDEMSTDVANVTCVINAYNIVFAVLLVSMGRLADQFGRRKFFVIGWRSHQSARLSARRPGRASG